MKKRPYLLACLMTGSSLVLPWEANAQTDPPPYTQATRYDPMGRVTGSIAPDPDGPSGPLRFAAVRNTFDSDGRLVLVERGELATWPDDTIAPANWTGFTVFSSVASLYDSYGRKTRDTVKGSDGVQYAVTEYSYDARNRLSCTAVRMTPTSYSGTVANDACALVSSTAPNQDRITKKTYDALDRTVLVQKAYGTSDQVNESAYTYNGNSNLIASMTDARGFSASMSYDGFGRQTYWYFPNPTTAGVSSTTDYEAYEYDDNGNRKSLRKRDGRKLTYTYDALNRVIIKVVPDLCVSGYACTAPPANAVRDIYYGYDLRGLQTFARFDSASGADSVDNVYDGFSELTSQTVSMGGVSRTVAFGYTTEGQRRKVIHPDGVSFVYTFDGVNRMTAVKVGGTTTVATMAYNANGGEANETRGSVTTTFGYDPESRLSSLADDLPGTSADITTTLGYNAASQLTSRTRNNLAYAWNGYTDISRNYAVNGLNQYTSSTSATYSYDANGNLVSDGTGGFIYDAENRLVADTSGTTLDYDPLGRLYKVTSGSSVETYLYAGDQRIAEYDASGTMTARYVSGAGEDNPLIWYAGSSTTNPLALQGDAQGSIVSVADANGTLLSINSYDEYGIPGNVRDTNGRITAFTNMGRYQYTGQLWVPQLGLYYYKARFYSPFLGRFMQTDSIGYADQNNLYAYVGNDPMDNADPDGNESCPHGTSCVPPPPASASRPQTSGSPSSSNQPTRGQRTQTGAQVVGTVGSARSVIANAAGPVSKGARIALHGAPGVLQAGAAALQIKGQMQDGKSFRRASVNVAGQTATNGVAGTLGSMVASLFTANPWVRGGAGLAAAAGVDVTGASDEVGKFAEDLAKSFRDNPTRTAQKWGELMNNGSYGP